MRRVKPIQSSDIISEKAAKLPSKMANDLKEACILAERLEQTLKRITRGYL